MATRHAKPDPDQLGLDFTSSFDERMRLIKSVKPERAGLSKRAWSPLRALLQEIEKCSAETGAGSEVRVKVLVDRLGKDRRTIQRTCRRCEEIGVLVVEGRSNPHTDADWSNHYKINYDRLQDLGRFVEREEPQGSELSNVAAAHQSASKANSVHAAPGRHDAAPGRHDAAPIYRSTVPLDRKISLVDQKNHMPWGADERIDWQKAMACAQQIARKIDKPQGPNKLTAANREFALKVAALSQQYGERWLNDAIEGLRQVRPRKAWAYLWSCLEDGAKQQRRHFRRDLSQLRPPDEMLRPPDRSQPQQSDLSERLCGASSEGGRRISEGGRV